MSDPETVLSAAFRDASTRDATELARIALRALDEAGYAVARVRFPGFAASYDVGVPGWRGFQHAEDEDLGRYASNGRYETEYRP